MPRPGRIKDQIGQSNEAVLAGIGYVKDPAGTTWEFLILTDNGMDLGGCQNRREEDSQRPIHAH